MVGAFVTYIGTDGFLPGVLTLNYSLIRYNNEFPFLVLVSSDVSENIVQALLAANIQFKITPPIENPNDMNSSDRGFKYTYTKLRIFDLVEYNVIVYLDADMLVCNNIERLFELPHMSAVVAGGLIEANREWKELNSGLLVVNPNRETFNSMCGELTKLKSKDGSDQGFLHAFYPDWPAMTALHLGHNFNVPFCYLDQYCEEFGFSFTYRRRRLVSNIGVIHYWGRVKPWSISPREFKRRSNLKWEQSVLLWWDTFREAVAKIAVIRSSPL